VFHKLVDKISYSCATVPRDTFSSVFVIYHYFIIIMVALVLQKRQTKAFMLIYDNGDADS